MDIFLCRFSSKVIMGQWFLLFSDADFHLKLFSDAGFGFKHGCPTRPQPVSSVQTTFTQYVWTFYYKLRDVLFSDSVGVMLNFQPYFV
jgi:hypothetical protein